jgi:hypothetical protein
MKRILEHIENKKAELAQSPFLLFLSDSSLEPGKRFGFVPCLAPFVMAFMDLNKHILRKEGSSEPLQQLLNTQSHEEESHWHMYLKDLRTLGLNPSLDFTQALKLLWGDDGRCTRQVVYELTSLFLRQEDPRVRLALVEAIEGTADVAFGVFSQAAHELEAQTGKRLYYFGLAHEQLEEKHTLGSEESTALLHAVQLPPALLEETLKAVDRIFALFALMFEEQLEYALRADTASVESLDEARRWRADTVRAA